MKPTNQIPLHRRQALSFDYRLYISTRGDWLIDSIVIFVYTPYPPAYLSCSLRSFSRSRLSARSRITFSMSYSPDPCFPIVPIPGYKYKDSASNSLLYILAFICSLCELFRWKIPKHIRISLWALFLSIYFVSRQLLLFDRKQNSYLFWNGQCGLFTSFLKVQHFNL